MPYTPQTWNNDDPATPISAERLAHMEAGIELVDTHADDTEDAHDASAISVVSNGSNVSTNVQVSLNAMDANKISNGAAVDLTSAQAVAGVKTFSSSPIVPTPSLVNQAANKTYVDSVASQGTPDADAATKGKLQLTNHLGGTAAAPTVPGLATKVALTGDETIAGIKTFSSSPIVPTPTTNFQAATKAYVDSIGGGGGGTLPGGWFAPESYGAIGNGIADDTAAIQLAIDAVKANVRGGVVYFDPTKKYLCAGRLNCSYINGLTMQGAAGNTALAGDIANEYSILLTAGNESISVSTNGTTTITATSGTPFNASHIGVPITGTNIPANAYIESVPGLGFSTPHSVNTAVLNAAATGSGTVTANVATPLINCAGTFGLTFANLKIHNNNSAFTGDIIAIVHAPNYGDAATGLIDDCVIGGTTSVVGNARYCVSFNAAITQLVRGSTFFYAKNLLGGKSNATGNVYSNVIQVENCHFLRHQEWQIKNSHEIWYFKACTFEPRQDNAAGTYKDSFGAFGPTVFEACWFGDTGDIGVGAPPWIEYKGRQLVLMNCLVNSPRGTGGVSVKLDSTGGTGTMEGITLIGNQFFSTSPVVQTTAGGAGINGFVAIGNVLTGTAPVILDDAALAIGNQVIMGNQGDAVTDTISARQTFEEGATFKVVAGPISDIHFTTAPPSGTIAGVDSSNNRLYVKVGSTWRYATLT